jgi:TRAP-type C4-dicarboxylate transport system permease small subunit
MVELGAVPMVAFALGYCALTQSNVVMDVVFTRLPHPVRTVLTVVTTFLSLGIWVLIAWQSAKSAIQQHLVGEITIIMKWPVYPLRYIFVLGAILLCLVLFVDLSKALREVDK